MEDMQKQVNNAFAELDVIEEMLWPLVAAQRLHQREDFGVRFPVTQTKEFQMLGLWLEQRAQQLQQIVSWIGRDAYRRRYIEAAMLMAVTKIRDLSERMIERSDIKFGDF